MQGQMRSYVKPKLVNPDWILTGFDLSDKYTSSVTKIKNWKYICGDFTNQTRAGYRILDQDVQRIGRWHEGLEIQSADKIQSATTVVMPFNADVLALIMKGLPEVGAEFIHPSLLRGPVTQNSTY